MRRVGILFAINSARFLPGKATMAYALRIALAAVVVAASSAVEAGPAAIGAVKNIVLVHGAITDGSGWRGVYDILTKDGYRVSVVQQPLTGLADDVAATKRIIDQQDGPVILVGHSYGGSIITVAGADPKVRALVYVAALQPDAGETSNQLAASMPAEVPSSDLKPTRTASFFLTRPSLPPTSRPICRQRKQNTWRTRKCRWRQPRSTRR
jgi:pimeloyl-ACP methyl ester carboxylesterase